MFAIFLAFLPKGRFFLASPFYDDNGLTLLFSISYLLL